MTTVTVMPRDHDWMPRDHEWTVDDLDDPPDDGLQYELFDGVLVVSAAPNIPHQRAVTACYRLLFNARRDALGVKNLTVAPALVVEVLSASTRSKDLIFKREMY